MAEVVESVYQREEVAMTARNHARLWRRALVVGIAGLILTQNGCSIIGLATGLQHDARKPKGGVYPGWQWAKITPGTDVMVRLTDGTKFEGTLMSVDQLPADVYAHHYTERRQSDPAVAILPTLHDSISLMLVTSEGVSGEFLGFDQQFDSGTVVPCIQLLPKGQQTTRRVDLRQVTKIKDAHQNDIVPDSITSLMRLKRLPVLSGLFFSTRSGPTQVPFDRIDRLVFHGGYGAVSGFLVGLVIDAAVVGIVALIADALSHLDLLGDGCFAC